MSPIIRDQIQIYIVCSCNVSTAEALHAVSRNPNKSEFKAQFSDKNFVLGKPIIFSTTPGSKEITQISISALEACNM